MNRKRPGRAARNPPARGPPCKQKAVPHGKRLSIYAVRTGLEPATSGVTGRHSNQLNYRTFKKRTTAIHWRLRLQIYKKLSFYKQQIKFFLPGFSSNNKHQRQRNRMIFAVKRPDDIIIFRIIPANGNGIQIIMITEIQS